MVKSMSFRLIWRLVGFVLCIGFVFAILRHLLWCGCPSFEKALTLSKAEVIETRVHLFYELRNQYPDTIAETSHCGATDVDAKYSLSDLLLDGWKSPFFYEARKEGYSLVSAGPDRVNGTKDDILWTWPRSKE